MSGVDIETINQNAIEARKHMEKAMSCMIIGSEMYDMAHKAILLIGKMQHITRVAVDIFAEEKQP